MLDVYFGPPGSGKTTYAAKLAHKAYKKGITVYANFDLKGAIRVTVEDIGKYNIHDGLLLIDEAGIDYNNRNWSKMSQNSIQYFKLHRHYKMDIAIFSQALDDADVTLRRLADHLYVIHKSPFPVCYWFSYLYKVKKDIHIDDISHLLTDEHIKVPLSERPFFRPKYQKYFNSWSRPDLPELPEGRLIPPYSRTEEKAAERNNNEM